MPKTKSKTPKLSADEQARVNELTLLAEKQRLAMLYQKRLKTLSAIDRIYAQAADR